MQATCQVFTADLVCHHERNEPCLTSALPGCCRADAGKVELDSGAEYLGFKLPFTISQLVAIETVLVGGAEVYRNRELDTEKRLYPGGVFGEEREAVLPAFPMFEMAILWALSRCGYSDLFTSA